MSLLAFAFAEQLKHCSANKQTRRKQRHHPIMSAVADAAVAGTTAGTR